MVNEEGVLEPESEEETEETEEEKVIKQYLVFISSSFVFAFFSDRAFVAADMSRFTSGFLSPPSSKPLIPGSNKGKEKEPCAGIQEEESPGIGPGELFEEDWSLNTCDHHYFCFPRRERGDQPLCLDCPLGAPLLAPTLYE